MRTAALVGLLVIVGCKKDVLPSAIDGPRAPDSTTELDALWALAPEGATVGLVVSPHGLELAERGALAIQALLASAPEMASAHQALQKAIGTTALNLAAAGLTHDRGFALFGIDKQDIAIVPVIDRDKFVAAGHGTKHGDTDTVNGMTCKTIETHYVCADDPAAFAKLGHGNLKAALGAAGARGDLELAATQLDGPASAGLAMVAQLAPGMMIVRGTVSELAPAALKMIGAGAKPRDGSAQAAGFGVIDLAPYLALVPALPIAPNLTAAQLARSIGGPVTFAIPGGTFDFGIHVPLRDPLPARALVEHCTEIPPLAASGATLKNGACHIENPKLGFAIDAWVEGDELRIGQRSAAAPVALAPSPLARELADGTWSMALFGRGSLFELAGAQGAVAMLQAMPIDVKPVLRGALMFNELGGGMRLDGNTVRFMVGVRTAWANPDAVVQKLLAASLDQVMADKTGEIGRSITSAAPGAPFGEDLKAGVGGVAAFVAPIGVIAGVAIPAAMDYMKRAKKSEAELQLNRLGKLATRHFAQAQAFPIGKTWLTPAAPCCEALDHHCPVDPKAWDAQPVWRALDFDVSSPSLYQYSYESDGKTFTARAVGDLDCDGVPATWELKGTSEAGEAHVALTRPPSGVE